MDPKSTHSIQTVPFLKVMAGAALIFGIMTLFSAGSVLFGPEKARDLAGDIVPFIVWFNFAAGFFYIIAAMGMWLKWDWAAGLSFMIALATGLAALAFVFYINSGKAFEMRTVGALIFRTGFWAGISFALHRRKS